MHGLNFGLLVRPAGARKAPRVLELFLFSPRPADLRKVLPAFPRLATSTQIKQCSSISKQKGAHTTEQVRTSDCHSPTKPRHKCPPIRGQAHTPTSPVVPVLRVPASSFQACSHPNTLFKCHSSQPSTLASLPERARISPPPSRLCRAPSMDDSTQIKGSYLLFRGD